ncbi:uncharacterized protein LOC129289862 [Prosopis cineraria]|uniref:uncharacterized protein LOC129289862 n=1 Tax=Prosopis cineraria TaxID=364024 RepID=UPI00240FBD26|nr:uncharacterized protein LOC129289862 [Prosopis cineraria]
MPFNLPMKTVFPNLFALFEIEVSASICPLHVSPIFPSFAFHFPSLFAGLESLHVQASSCWRSVVLCSVSLCPSTSILVRKMAKRQRNKVNNKRKHETLMKENDKTLTDRVSLERKSDRGMSYNPTTSTAHTSSSPEFQLPPPATFHDPDHTNHIEKEMEAPTKINTNFEDLPQDLIHSIMNYLPCKDAFRLGVSSKAFYSLWLSNPVLHFDNRSFVRDEEEEEDEDESEDDDDEDESEDEETRTRTK